MPVKVMKDGQMVERLGGASAVGPTGKTVYAGYTTIEMAGHILKDEEVSEELLEVVKEGDHPGLAYFETEEEAHKADVPGEPEPQPPMSNAPGDDGGDQDTDDDAEPDYQDDPGYDPNDYTQPQVLEYLKTASPNEVKRVQDVESQGQSRQQIMGFKADDE